MAKKFALVSFGVLCLSVSALIGTHLLQPAVASPVEDIIFFDQTFALDRFGQTWNTASHVDPVCWARVPIRDAPIPVEQIVYWSQVSAYDTNGDWWVFTGLGWDNCGPWPGAPVPTSQSTWGAVKEEFGKGE